MIYSRNNQLIKFYGKKNGYREGQKSSLSQNKKTAGSKEADAGSQEKERKEKQPEINNIPAQKAWLKLYK